MALLQVLLWLYYSFIMALLQVVLWLYYSFIMVASFIVIFSFCHHLIDIHLYKFFTCLGVNKICLNHGCILGFIMV